MQDATVTLKGRPVLQIISTPRYRCRIENQTGDGKHMAGEDTDEHIAANTDSGERESHAVVTDRPGVGTAVGVAAPVVGGLLTAAVAAILWGPFNTATGPSAQTSANVALRPHLQGLIPPRPVVAPEATPAAPAPLRGGSDDPHPPRPPEPRRQPPAPSEPVPPPPAPDVPAPAAP